MYVGGTFQYVQKGANPGPGEKIEQHYLAAFDVATGEWRPGFRPVLDGEVWDIQPTPDGKLIVGGAFTNANGAADTAGLAALDPVTGATVAGWRAAIEDRRTTPNPRVRALDLQDGWIYVGGTFTHIRGGNPVASPIQLNKAARVRVSDGRPDSTWKPVFNAEVIDLDASAQGDRVYLSGHFTTLYGAEARKVAALTTSSPAQAVPGLPTNSWVPSTTDVQKQYQQAIREFGNSVWQGGSEHIAGKYDRSTYAFQRSMTTTPNGGDVQALAEVDGVVYVGCHCTGFAYQDSHTWPTPTPGWTQADGVNRTIAFDAQTMELIPEFVVSTDTRGGNGTWELTPDTNGCLWFGGDYTRGSFQSTGYQWLGGFGKVCARDTNPPSTPTNLSATSGSTGVRLAWSASSSNDGLRYEVLRDDRVITTTSGTSYTDTRLEVGQTATYWVRAIDTPGNRSATTAGVTGMRTA
jgi:trimeric autotransporter adhesin